MELVVFDGNKLSMAPNRSIISMNASVYFEFTRLFYLLTFIGGFVDDRSHFDSGEKGRIANPLTG